MGDIDAYLATLRHATRRKRNDLPYSFSKIEKAPDLGKRRRRRPCIQNTVLRASGRKNCQSVSMWDRFFLCFWQNVYQSALVSQNLLRSEKLCSGSILFPKCSIFNVWQCPEYACLDNCSVICTLTQYIYIQNSAYSDICRHIQAYSALLILFRMGLFVAAHSLFAPSLKSVTYILQWWNLSQL